MGLPKRKRGLVSLLLGCLCFAWSFAAYGTSVFVVQPDGDDGAETRSDIWYSCVRAPVAAGDPKPVAVCTDLSDAAIRCDDLEHRANTMRAFYVMTTLFCVAFIALSATDHFGELDRALAWLKLKNTLVYWSVFTAILAAISGGVAISYARTQFCGMGDGAPSDRAGFRWGASPFMMLLVCVTAIVQLVLSAVLPARKADPVPGVADVSAPPASAKEDPSAA